MKTVYQSDFFLIEFDEEKKIIKSLWKEKKSEITEEQIKTEIEKAASIITEYKPSFIITDDRSRTFIYTVEIQQWVGLTLYKACVEAGIKKFAVLLPKDIVAQMSTEQVAEEKRGIRKYELNMFSDEDKALEWLNI